MKQKTHLTHVHTTPTAITIQNLKLNLPALDQNENPCQVKNKIPRLGSNKPNDFNQNYHGTFSKRVPLCSSGKSRTAHGNAALVSLHRDSPRPRPSRALSFSRCKMKRRRPGPRTVRTPRDCRWPGVTPPRAQSRAKSLCSCHFCYKTEGSSHLVPAEPNTKDQELQ